MSQHIDKKAYYSHMKNKYFSINLAFFFWLLALVSHLLHTDLMTAVAGALSISGFIIHIRQNQVESMFKKRHLIDNPQFTTHDKTSPDEKLSSDAKENNSTVIARSTCFKGDILSDGQVHISGRLKGNIDAKDSVIKIIKGGIVEGNITCRELFVNGNLVGNCTCDSLQIAENGKISGTITYNTLTINKGGVFSGQAEAILQNEDSKTYNTTSPNNKPTLIASIEPNTPPLEKKAP
ncbi:TPA: polymer-forming cytoskeletal protein [Salmonella enterica subsp. enterica serovar Newport]